MKKTAVMLLLILASAGPLFAVFGTAGGAASFLRTGAGARALSLSGAFTAYYDDASSSYWNPGAIALQKLASATSMFSWITQDRSYNYFSAQFPSIYGSFAISYINFSAGEIEGRLSDTSAYYTFTDSENAYFITYARNVLDNIYLGLSLKYLHVSLDSYGAYGLSGDLGALVKFNDFVSLGLVFQDIAGSLQWTTGTMEKIPMLMRVGTLLKFMEGGIKWSADAEENEFDGLSFKTGVEAVIIRIISVRAGISYGASNYKFDYTFGGGLKYAFGGFIFKLDYCFLKEDFYSVVEANHKVSLDVYFSI